MNAFNERRQMRGQGGFTLIELLVVIAILGILAGVVVFAVGNTTDDAKTNACKVEERAIKTAIQAAKGTETTADGAGSFLDTGAPKYWTLVGTSSYAANPTTNAATNCTAL